MKKQLFLKVHFMPGDGHGWALDEDRRQMRQALKGIVHETTLAKAEIIHTPFWQGLSVVHPEILKKAFIIAHADNPPFFYLKQPEFLQGQQQVDLWVARSQEALKQFQELNLPVTYIPYTIDETLFFPIEDKKFLRKKFGIPEKAYVIANFHRDSEGSNLSTPKFQKAPELMLAILKKLQERGVPFHVLLAGPRRHWIREALKREVIPFTFVGKSELEGDDFGINILNRSTLNELMNAADVMLIPSRWEGGPQSVMEGAASRCKILSTPLGLANDILEPRSLYHSISEAVDRIAEDQERDVLQSTLETQWERWHRSHTMESMCEGLRQLYQQLSKNDCMQKKNAARGSWIQACGQQLVHTIRSRWLPKKRLRVVGWNHQVGQDSDLDAIFCELEKILEACHITRQAATGEGIEFIGWPEESLPSAVKNGQRFQWVVPSLPLSYVLSEAAVITPAVQDSVNLRRAGLLNPTIVLPVPFFEYEEKIASDEPLLVEEGDSTASIKIWKAMATGRPIIYPALSAYYEQVFHGGFSYKNKEEIPALLEIAWKEAPELRMLAKVPTRESAKKAIRQLLGNLL
ncbi:MAG: glycosyltransferase family 4 protein [Chthoniobacterales bacterium]